MQEVPSSPTHSDDEAEVPGIAENGDLPPIAIELFCGGASLSLALNKAGFEVIAVDYEANKDKPPILF